MTETIVGDRSAWQPFFDELTEGAGGPLVTIEVVDNDLGDQIEVERNPFVASTYDPRRLLSRLRWPSVPKIHPAFRDT